MFFFFFYHENIRKQWAWGSPSLRKPPYYGAWLQPRRSQLHGERQWFEAKTDVQWINKALVFFTKWLSPWNGCEEAGQELAEEQEQTSLVFFTSSPWRGKGPDQRVLNCLECEVSSQWPHAHSSMIVPIMLSESPGFGWRGPCFLGSHWIKPIISKQSSSKCYQKDDLGMGQNCWRQKCMVSDPKSDKGIVAIFLCVPIFWPHTISKKSTGQKSLYFHHAVNTIWFFNSSPWYRWKIAHF